MKKEITQSFEKGFNRSSKIMEYKIGIHEARLLNTLVYKHNYWEERDELIEIDQGMSFYITIPNLQVETNLSPGIIKRCLKKLKKSGLVQIYRKGIPAKNHYILNRDAIENFDAKYKEEYETWADKIYESASEDRARFEEKVKENSSLSRMESQIGQNNLTSGVNMIQLDGSKSTVTKNKNTNNKITNNNTNRINADVKIELSQDDLELRISDLQQANDEDRSKLSEELFHILCNSSKKFMHFAPSNKDFELIYAIADSPVASHFLASKILGNARAIIDNRKECRFGNLFIGIKEMSDNVEMKYLS